MLTYIPSASEQIDFEVQADLNGGLFQINPQTSIPIPKTKLTLAQARAEFDNLLNSHFSSITAAIPSLTKRQLNNLRVNSVMGIISYNSIGNIISSETVLNQEMLNKVLESHYSIRNLSVQELEKRK